MGMRFIDMESPNYWVDASPVQAIVLHGTAGALAGAISTLRNPRVDKPSLAVSANFVVSKAGNIYRLVDPEKSRKAWANGVVENFDKSIAWLVQAVAQKRNINRITWSIEHEATESEMRKRASMPDAQFNSSIDLTAYLLVLAGLKISNQTVIGHYQISGTIKYNCPGVIFPPAYVEVLKERYPGLA